MKFIKCDVCAAQKLEATAKKTWTELSFFLGSVGEDSDTCIGDVELCEDCMEKLPEDWDQTISQVVEALKFLVTRQPLEELHATTANL